VQHSIQTLEPKQIWSRWQPTTICWWCNLGTGVSLGNRWLCLMPLVVRQMWLFPALFSVLMSCSRVGAAPPPASSLDAFVCHTNVTGAGAGLHFYLICRNEYSLLCMLCLCCGDGHQIRPTDICQWAEGPCLRGYCCTPSHPSHPLVGLQSRQRSAIIACMLPYLFNGCAE
jgi:hypothetical protein